MREKIIWITALVRLIGVLMLGGLVVDMFIPQKIYLEGDNITIRHLFTSKILLKDVLGITERVSSKSGKKFYFIDTANGSYEVDDGSFLLRAGRQIINKAGFSKKEVHEGNINAVYCLPKAYVDFRNRTETEEIPYDFRKVHRARSADQRFSEVYFSIFITLISLSIIIPCGYCSLHPEDYKIVFPTWTPKEKPISLNWARGVSFCLLLVGVALLVFCNGLIIIF